MHLLQHQRVEIQVESRNATPGVASAPLSRVQRAHTRLSWGQRLVRNARATREVKPTITLFGVPEAFAALLGLRAS